jgi:hypothetical protein
MCGDELIGWLREHHPTLKALILTGHADILDGGVPGWWTTQSHLAKPFSILLALRDTVHQLLARGRSSGPCAASPRFPAVLLRRWQHPRAHDTGWLSQAGAPVQRPGRCADVCIPAPFCRAAPSSARRRRRRHYRSHKPLRNSGAKRPAAGTALTWWPRFLTRSTAIN